MHLRRRLLNGVRSLAGVLLSGLSLVGCQAVLGDFTIDDSDVDSGGLGAACSPSSFRCQGERLERCRDNRKRYEPFMHCASAGACDPTAGACRPCTPGQVACNEQVLEVCTAEGGWAVQDTCVTPALCRVDADRGGGHCEPALCDPGTFVCQSGRLLGCAKSRDRFVLVEDCGADARCDAAAAAAAVAAGALPHCAAGACGDACPPPACKTPGAIRCSTVVPAVEVCGTDGQWTFREACVNGSLCNASLGGCLPPACREGESRCVGQTRQTCADDQTRFADAERCLATETCTPEGCEPTPCAEDSVRCNDRAFERCVDGAFVAENRCATATLCRTDPGGCVAPTCGEELAQYFCSPAQILSDCRVGRDGWREIQTCTGDTVCDVNAGRCVQMP